MADPRPEHELQEELLPDDGLIEDHLMEDDQQKLGEAESGHIGMRMDMTQKYFGG